MSSISGLPALEDADLHMAPDHVQVWQAWLDLPENELEYCRGLLSESEAARAGRFFFERDRNHYIAARALLRELLGRYLGMLPEQVSLGLQPHGKPELQGAAASSGLQFNLSHSNGLAVYAFCQDELVGVDVEFTRPMPDIDSLAQQFFAASEIEWLAGHEGQDKLAGFFKIWTAKEAFFKHSGDGLLAPIDQAEIELGPDLSPRLARLAGSPQVAAGWQIVSFEPLPGYCAALALHVSGWQMQNTWIPGRGSTGCANRGTEK